MSGGGPVSGAQLRDPLGALRAGRVRGEGARLEAATRLLEGTFYQEMFKAMRTTVPEGGALSGGAGADLFTGLMDQHVSDAAALKSDRGLGQALYHYLARGLDAPAGDPEV